MWDWMACICYSLRTICKHFIKHKIFFSIFILQIIFFPSPVWRNKDIVVITFAITGLCQHICASHLNTAIVFSLNQRWKWWFDAFDPWILSKDVVLAVQYSKHRRSCYRDLGDLGPPWQGKELVYQEPESIEVLSSIQGNQFMMLRRLSFSNKCMSLFIILWYMKALKLIVS